MDEITIEEACPYFYDCIHPKSCINGVIDDSGIGLIDIRIKEDVSTRIHALKFSFECVCEREKDCPFCLHRHSRIALHFQI